MAEKIKTGRGGAALYLVALVITLLARLPSLWVPWQYDDYHHIAENPAVMRLANVPRFFVDPKLFSNQVMKEGMYRPLLMTTHAFTYAVFGGGPFGAHLVNLVLQLINTALALALLRRWTGRDSVALLAAIAWSLLAVQTETVAYAAARSTLLASAFMLAAVLVTEGEGRQWGRAGLAALFFILALLSKEIAFVLPLLILMRDLTIGRARGLNPARRWPIYALTFALMPAYLALRALLFSSTLAAAYMPRFTYLITQAKVFFIYLGWTLFPFNLTPLPDVVVAPGPFSPPVIAGALGVAVLLGSGVLLRHRAPRYSFGIWWFALGLMPTSTIAPLYLIASAERLYLPLLGVAVIAAAALESSLRDAPRRAKVAIGLSAAVIALNAALGLHLQSVWRTTTGIARQMVRMAPGKSEAWVWLGIMEMYDNRLEPARKHILKAIRLNPDDPLAADSYAKLQLLMKPDGSARQALEAVLRDPAALPQAKLNALIRLAAFDIDDGKLEQAKQRARLVLENQPENYEAFMILGLVAEKRGDVAAAKDNYHRALEILPDYPQVETRLGVIELREGDMAGARRLLSAAATSETPVPEAMVSLGLMDLQEGREEEARSLLERAVAADPNSALGYVGLGKYYLARGTPDRAEDYFNRALAKNPDVTDAREGLALIYLGRAESEKSAEQDREQWLDKAAEQLKWLRPRGLDPELIARWERLAGRRLQ